MHRRITGLIASAALVAAACNGWAYAPGPPQKFLSPGKFWTVEVVTQDPGGVGAPQTIVKLYPSRQKVAAYDDNILIVEGAHTVSVVWDTTKPNHPKSVAITCDGCDLENAELAVDKKEELTITYQTH